MSVCVHVPGGGEVRTGGRESPSAHYDLASKSHTISVAPSVPRSESLLGIFSPVTLPASLQPSLLSEIRQRVALLRKTLPLCFAVIVSRPQVRQGNPCDPPTEALRSQQHAKRRGTRLSLALP